MKHYSGHINAITVFLLISFRLLDLALGFSSGLELSSPLSSRQQQISCHSAAAAAAQCHTSSTAARLLYTARSSTNKRRRHNHGCIYNHRDDATILKSSSSSSSSADAVNHAAAPETNDTTSDYNDHDNNQYDDDDEEEEEEIIQKSMEYLANLIQVHLHSRQQQRNKLHYSEGSTDDDQDGSNNNDGAAAAAAAAAGGIDDSSSNSDDDNDVGNNIGYQLAQGRFVDLTTTIEGEHLLERLFLLTAAATTTTTTINNDDSSIPSQSDDETVVAASSSSSTTTPSRPNKRIIQYAITTLQSLLIYGMQIGVKGSEESQKKMVRHLFRRTDTDNHHHNNNSWISHWDSECIRRLKFYRDTTLGKQLLGQLIRKRTSKGAYELLVEMGVWDRHTDVALLRSGFPVRFTDDELVISMEAEKKMMKKEEGGDYECYKDPDEILGIRCDLREQKIYTIDSASTLDIDDGIAVEVLGDDHEATPRHRYWIHIADVDRWAPRGSKLLSVAERRGTSLYLPTMTLCMFPPK
jgi:exoribonuclease R